MQIRTVEKVTAFITRWQNETAEMLVLHHPLAGHQLPAGTVEIDEPPEKALLREVVEETQLVDVEIIAHLDTIESTLSDDEGIILLATKLFSSPSYDASSEGFILERGLPVQVKNVIGKYSEILCNPMDLHQQPAVRQLDVSGYVRSSVLGKQVRRHLYQLRPTTQTPESWSVQADGHLFEFHWHKLDPRPILHPDQSDWLEAVYGKLITIDSPDESNVD